MARKRRGVMSEQLKYELAKDLGFYDTVQKEGWGGIRAKDAGNMVKRALQIAEKTLAEQARQQTQSRAATAPPMRQTVGATMGGGTLTHSVAAVQSAGTMAMPQRYKP